jgi:AcrR family transcriptional regulator
MLASHVMAAAKKNYRTQYRRNQSRLLIEGTRSVILMGARNVFNDRGYGATTMEAIAKEAGVAVQTVYANFGSKRAMVIDLLQLAHSDGDLIEIIGRFAKETDPAKKLRLGVSFNRIFYERAADVYRILLGAAASDPKIAELEQVAEEERRQRCAGMARGWARAGTLRKGVTQREATDVLFTLTGPEVFRLLVTRSGWTAVEYEDWLLMSLESFLLGRALHPVVGASRPAVRRPPRATKAH